MGPRPDCLHQLLIKWERRARDNHGQAEISSFLTAQLRPTSQQADSRQIAWHDPTEVATVIAWRRQFISNDSFKLSRDAMDKWGGHPEDLIVTTSVIEWHRLRPADECSGRGPTRFALLILLLMTGTRAPFLRRVRSLKDARWRLQQLVTGLLRFQTLPAEAAMQNYGCIRLFPSWPGLPLMYPTWQLPIHDGLKIALDLIVDLN